MNAASGKPTPPTIPDHVSDPKGHVHSDVLWRPRTDSAEKSVAQYSRFVARMKIALPVMAGVILLLVLLFPQFRGESERFRVGVKKLDEITSDALSMINARYVGTDDDGHPYTITASSAKERSSEDKAIDLVSPKADLTTSDGHWVKITALNGVYDRNTQLLDLGGKVDVYQEQGYEMHSTAARFSVKDRIATGNAPVTGKGSFGTIVAAGFSVTDNGTIVNFTGPVTLVLDHKHDTNTDAAPADPSAPPPVSPGGEHKP